MAVRLSRKLIALDASCTTHSAIQAVIVTLH